MRPFYATPLNPPPAKNPFRNRNYLAHEIGSGRFMLLADGACQGCSQRNNRRASVVIPCGWRATKGP